MRETKGERERETHRERQRERERERERQSRNVGYSQRSLFGSFSPKGQPTVAKGHKPELRRREK